MAVPPILFCGNCTVVVTVRVADDDPDSYLCETCDTRINCEDCGRAWTDQHVCRDAARPPQPDLFGGVQ